MTSKYKNLLDFTVKWSEKLISEIHRNNLKILDEYKKKKTRISLAITSIYSELNVRQRFKLVELLLTKIKNSLETIGHKGFIIKAKLEDSKLLVGSSTGVLEAVLEVGMTWDHILDLPYIPGSTLKGAVKTVSEGILDEPRIIKLLFGNSSLGESERSLGCLEFFDAYPVATRGSLLEVDIVTPHYYRGGRVLDNELKVNPLPIPHLAVAPNTIFAFVVGHRCPGGVFDSIRKRLNVKADPSDLVLVILLGLAFRMGIGARTTKGYGVFRIIDVRS